MFPNTSAVEQYSIATMNAYMRGVFRWMAYGLSVTMLLSYVILSNKGIMLYLSESPGILLLLCIAELALVLYLVSRMASLSGTQVTGYYFIYSALNGVTIAPLLALYTAGSIISVLGITIATFAVMTLYGYYTKRDLTSWGSFLTMGLMGIIIASLVNMFLRSSEVQVVLNYIGVLVFVGLTAYDVQKLRRFGVGMPSDPNVAQKGIILGALTLYLDFINLFITLLQILGTRRD